MRQWLRAFFIFSNYIYIFCTLQPSFFMILFGDHTGFFQIFKRIVHKSEQLRSYHDALACKGAEAEAENTIQQPAQKRNVGHVRGKKALSTCPLVHIAEEGFSCAVIQCFYNGILQKRIDFLFVQSNHPTTTSTGRKDRGNTDSSEIYAVYC